MIVVNADLVIACPRQMPEETPKVGARGEGTWWTLRHALHVSKPVIVIWPDGSIEERGDR